MCGPTLLVYQMLAAVLQSPCWGHGEARWPCRWTNSLSAACRAALGREAREFGVLESRKVTDRPVVGGDPASL